VHTELPTACARWLYPRSQIQRSAFCQLLFSFFSFYFFYIKRVSFFKIFDRALKEYGSLGKKKKRNQKK